MMDIFRKKSLVIVALLSMFIVTGCAVNQGNGLSDKAVSQQELESPVNTKSKIHNVSNNVAVKYRDDLVDINNQNFEYLDTSKSSFIRGAYYDEKNQYLVIKLNSTYYHYCSMSVSTWELFKTANSFGTFYNTSIKDKFDCRTGLVPDYN